MSALDGFPPLSAETVDLYLPLAVDNALPDAVADRLFEMIADDPERLAMLEDLQGLDKALPDSLGGVMGAPVPLNLARAASGLAAEPRPEIPPALSGAQSAPVARLDERRPRRQVWQALAAAAVAAVALPSAYWLGSDAGYKAAETDARQQFGWVAQIAGYHAFYAAQENHLVEVGPEDPVAVVRWLSDSLGAPVRVPDLSDEGLTFAGARMLVASGRPIAQIMYTQPDGRPIGYCITRVGPNPRALSAGPRDDLMLARWHRDGLGHVVVGWESADRLTAVSKRIGGADI